MTSIKPHIIKYGGIWYTIVDNKIAYPSSQIKDAIETARRLTDYRPKEWGITIH